MCIFQSEQVNWTAILTQ